MLDGLSFVANIFLTHIRLCKLYPTVNSKEDFKENPQPQNHSLPMTRSKRKSKHSMNNRT